MTVATIAEQRAAIATALSGVASLKVKPRPVTGNLKANDGWVNVGKIRPFDFAASMAEFTAVVVLGTDPNLAETRMETLAVELLDTITTLAVTDVSIEPQLMVGGDAAAANVYILALSFSMEVS